nr:hypothetical protein [Tanacetum cinerariifolium]
NGESTDSILSKPAVKFVKAAERSTTNKAETMKKPAVRYVELYRKPTKKPTVRGNQRNWNNLKSQQLGSIPTYGILSTSASTWMPRRHTWLTRVHTWLTCDMPRGGPGPDPIQTWPCPTLTVYQPPLTGSPVVVNGGPAAVNGGSPPATVVDRHR